MSALADEGQVLGADPKETVVMIKRTRLQKPRGPSQPLPNNAVGTDGGVDRGHPGGTRRVFINHLVSPGRIRVAVVPYDIGPLDISGRKGDGVVVAPSVIVHLPQFRLGPMQAIGALRVTGRTFVNDRSVQVS